MIMKALSVSQPWTWAILYAGKWIENRKWSTAFRGWFLIHAPKSWDREGYDYLCTIPNIDLPAPIDFRSGGIVGIAYLSNCINRSPSKWFTGPYGFVLALAQPLTFHACPGQLRFFDIEVPPHLITHIKSIVPTKQ